MDVVDCVTFWRCMRLVTDVGVVAALRKNIRTRESNDTLSGMTFDPSHNTSSFTCARTDVHSPFET